MQFRKLSLAALAMVIVIGWLLVGCISYQGPDSKKELNTEVEKSSYALGQSAANEFKGAELEIDLDLFAQGLGDVLAGGEPLLTDTEAADILIDLSQRLQEERTFRQMQIAANNKERGEQFLSENGKKEGVVTTESGLQYKVFKEGDGPQPGLDDQITVHYSITFVDGTEFDSTFQGREPTTIEINDLVDGLIEGVPLMSLGGRYQFFIPSHLAYGEGGAGDGLIQPNSVLIYEIELLSFGE